MAVGISAVSIRSFTPNGKPCSGPAQPGLLDLTRLGEHGIGIEMYPCLDPIASRSRWRADTARAICSAVDFARGGDAGRLRSR